MNQTMCLLMAFFCLCITHNSTAQDQRISQEEIVKAKKEVLAARDDLFAAKQALRRFKKFEKKKITDKAERKAKKQRLKETIQEKQFAVKELVLVSFREESIAESASFENPDDDYIDGSKIEFFGSGAIQRAVSDQGEIPANVGLGVLYDRIYKQPTSFLGVRRIEVAININVASTVDTIVANYEYDEALQKNVVTNMRDLGTAILLPSNSGRAAMAFTRIYFDPTSWVTNPTSVLTLSGVQIRLIGSSRIWSLDSLNPASQLRESYQVIGSTLAGRMGLFYDVLPNRPQLRKDFSISLGVDYSWRWLFSDLGTRKNADREKFLNGSSKTTFHGLEPYISIRLKNIRAEVSIPILITSKPENKIRGLTGPQFVTSISFTGGFPLKIDTNRKPTSAPTDSDGSGN